MTERDEAIVKQYDEGKTMADLATEHGISRMRVRQIVRKAGVYKPYRDVQHMGRDEFLGVNLTKEAKDALRAKAGEAGKSMSEMVSDEVERMVTE